MNIELWTPTFFVGLGAGILGALVIALVLRVLARRISKSATEPSSSSNWLGASRGDLMAVAGMVSIIVVAIILFVGAYRNVFSALTDGVTQSELEFIAANLAALIPIVTGMVKAADVLYDRIDSILQTKAKLALLDKIRDSADGYILHLDEWPTAYQLRADGQIVFGWKKSNGHWVTNLKEE